MSRNILQKHSDEDLMAIFKFGRDHTVFEALYNRYYQSLCKNLIWLGANEETAKDVVQSVFLKIFHQPQTFDTSKSFKTWLFVVAKNKWNNELRTNANRSKYDLLASTFMQSFEMPQKYSNKAHAVAKAIQNLSENHKEVITLKYSNNLSLKEISEVLDCSLGTVKSRLFYAIQQLKNNLKNEQ